MDRPFKEMQLRVIKIKSNVLVFSFSQISEDSEMKLQILGFIPGLTQILHGDLHFIVCVAATQA